MITFKKLNVKNEREIDYVINQDSSISNLFLTWNSVGEDWKSNRKESLENLNENKEFFLLAFKHDQIIGFHYLVISKWNPLRADIYTTWVDEKFRNQNIGYKLKVQGEEWARLKGVKYLMTAVDMANVPMVQLNLKHGFYPVRTHYLKEL